MAKTNFFGVLLVSTFVFAEKSVKTFINEHIKIPSFLANANMFVFICSVFIKKSCFLTFAPKSKMFFIFFSLRSKCFPLYLLYFILRINEQIFSKIPTFSPPIYTNM
uniref:Uncharacterized protein n=1 Tax=Cacopsylla melanoneura TaxID=428564 RepID=A0A8D8WEA2_9HEMI